tara:strand:+ start:2629 stop:2895 length:267 start_codon:yes stop_codon:yes gene_type:complete
MKHQLKIILVFMFFFSACQTNSTFDQLNMNSIDLTRITGEAPSPQSFFDSTLWSAILGAALLAALSSTESSYKSTNMDSAELDSEWIE